MIDDLPKSTLTKNQQKQLVPHHFVENGVPYTLTVSLRFDDRCNNGHNTFSITGEITRRSKLEVSGCVHKEIAVHAPEVADLIKWHLCSSDGPFHYIANTIYFAQQGNLAAARKSAIWEDADLADFTEENLRARLPALMQEFKKAIEKLGFTY